MRRTLIVLAGVLLALGVVGPVPASPLPAAGSGVVTVDASEDTFVNVAYPGANFGRKPVVKIDNNPKTGLFRFVVTEVPDGTQVISATLNLVAVGDRRAKTVDVHTVSDDWDESTTYKSRPELGPRVDSGLIEPGGTSRFTVPVDGNGTYSFAVVRTARGRDNLVASSEHPRKGHRPTLTVRLGEAPPSVPPPVPACDNGIDDDDDTFIDLADPDCESATDPDESDGTTPPPPPPLPACDNGIDDDDDTFVDLADPDCESATDPDESDGTTPPPPVPACDNGLDDDADTLIDLADPDCESATDPDESDGTTPPPPVPACDNGLDDDLDGLVDDLDPGCSSPTDTDEDDTTPPPPPAACSNRVDDDLDGLVDDLDPGCSSPDDTDESNTTPPPPPAACGNSRDDDADGLIDLADPGCAATTDDDETDGSTPPPDPDNPFIAYQPGSFFNTPLPRSGVPVAADSSAGIAWHVANEPAGFPRIRGVGGNQWGQAFSIGDCADPLWRIESTGTVPAGQEFLFTQGFHADAGFGARIPVNSDSPILVIDRCGVAARPGGFSLWAANVRYAGTPVLTSGGDGTIIAGAFAHDSNGLDRRNSRSNSQFNERSRGAVPDAMVIRDDLLDAAEAGANGGTLGHVLHMFAMETNSAAGVAHPMVGAESGKAGYGAEGQRLRVKESWRPPAGCDGPGLVIARTLQRYGAYLGDNSGSGSGIKAEQGSSYPGLSVDALGGCITWSDMQYVTPGWYAAAP